MQAAAGKQGNDGNELAPPTSRVKQKPSPKPNLSCTSRPPDRVSDLKKATPASKVLPRNASSPKAPASRHQAGNSGLLNEDEGGGAVLSSSNEPGNKLQNQRNLVADTAVEGRRSADQGRVLFLACRSRLVDRIEAETVSP